MNKLRGYLRLMRLPNIVTAISDVLAGIAIGASNLANTFGRVSDHHISFGELLVTNESLAPLKPIGLLVLSTIGLYGGGVVMNDVFDAELDKRERPERPIPSGLISKRAATVLGISLLVIGVLAAALSGDNIFSFSFVFALAIAIAALVYDRWAKHHNFLGPLTMGFCRGCNLLLGISILGYAVPGFWHLAIVPLIYIAAITMVSRGEVHGGKKTTLYFALILYFLVMLAIVFVGYSNSALRATLPFLLILALMILVPLQNAIKDPRGANIGKAVKGGVLGIIALNAAWAAAFGDMFFAILIILLLPLSILLARLFAVT